MKHEYLSMCSITARITIAGLLASGAAGYALAASDKPYEVSERMASLRADPLFSVDANRSEIVDRLASQWETDVSAAQRDSFKQKLAGLRADRLLAVSLVGSFDGVLKILYGQEVSDKALATLSMTRGIDDQKALGDPNKDLAYTPLTPCRLFDTRAGQSSALGQLGGAFTPNTSRTVTPAGGCAIPSAGLNSLFVSMTTLNNTPNSGGYVTLLSPTAALNTTTDIFNLGSQWSAANTIVSTGAAGQFVTYVSTANAHVVVDVLGYFAAPTTGNGLRVIQAGTNAPIVINGSSTNTVGNTGGTQLGVTMSGGANNRGGSPTGEYGRYSTIGGGSSNRTGKDDNSDGDYATIGGGYFNYAAGSYSTIPGGAGNITLGVASFAAGQLATAAHDGSFVWGDVSTTGTPITSTAPNQFVIRAVGGVQLSPATNLNFGSTVRQMINLWGAAGEYGIGVQSAVQYARTASTGRFCWFKGGVHADGNGACTPGSGGTTLMDLTSSGLVVNGIVASASDRNLKENFSAVNGKTVLAKVVSLPLTAWNYKADDRKTRHVGPMAQDFKRAFGVGSDDKFITTVDASGVALAAIQGLNQKLVAKDAAIAALQRELAAIKKKLGM